MAQITVYVPDGVARKIRRDAARAKKSLSAYVSDLAARRRRRKAWPDAFFALQGRCRGSLVVPDDPPPEETGEA
jgi:hypothetical protein